LRFPQNEKYMPRKDTRWKQRFSNFTKVIYHLEQALEIKDPDFVQKAGIIQFFEMSYDLAWNMLKDYLEEQGFDDVKSPRTALKKAYEIGILENGHFWMNLLVDRNMMSHTYDEARATEVDKQIQEVYFPLLKKLYLDFKQKVDE
jgi:nucleotidyltransferase substrate binding protein (TIGR01987 family)